MALTGLIDNTAYIRTDKPAQITGSVFGNGRLSINGAYNYKPIYGVSTIDDSTQVATTKFVSEAKPFSQQLTDKFELETNRFYHLKISNDTTIVLPQPTVIWVNNEIVVQYEWVSGVLNVGTDWFLDGETPVFDTAHRFGSLYFDFNPMRNKWGCGVVYITG